MSMDCIPSETLATLGYQREGPKRSLGGVERSETVFQAYTLRSEATIEDNY